MEIIYVTPARVPRAAQILGISEEEVIKKVKDAESKNQVYYIIIDSVRMNISE